MAFPQTWTAIQNNITPGLVVPNWTKDRKYLGDSFEIGTMLYSQVDVISPNATNIQCVPKNDFEIVYLCWPLYMSGAVKRSAIRDDTRYSKYIISIFHWLENQLGGQLP